MPRWAKNTAFFHSNDQAALFRVHATLVVGRLNQFLIIAEKHRKRLTFSPVNDDISKANTSVVILWILVVANSAGAS